MPFMENEKRAFSRDRLAVSWIALNRNANFTGHVYTDWIEFDLSDRLSVCRPLARYIDPNSQTVLSSVVHHGLLYKNPYVSQKVQHTLREAAHTWLQQSKSANKTEFEVCAQRPLEIEPNNTISSARINVVSFSRQGGRSGGLVKLNVRHGKSCEWITMPQPDTEDDKISDFRSRVRIFLTARLHQNDACNNDEACPIVIAWVERSALDGFAVCADSIPSNMREANSALFIDLGENPSDANMTSTESDKVSLQSSYPEQWRRLYNSVQVHWHALSETFDDGSFCQAVPADE